MVTGHVSVAILANRIRGRVPLWALVVAALGPDLTQFALYGLGIDDSKEMLSHSIPAASLIATVFALTYWLVRRDGRGALLIAAFTLSHLPLDYLTGSKPTWPGGPEIGLGLYSRPYVDLTLELGLLALAAVTYWKSSPRRGPIPRAAYVVALGALVMLQVWWARTAT